MAGHKRILQNGATSTIKKRQRRSPYIQDSQAPTTPPPHRRASRIDGRSRLLPLTTGPARRLCFDSELSTDHISHNSSPHISDASQPPSTPPQTENLPSTSQNASTSQLKIPAASSSLSTTIINLGFPTCVCNFCGACFWFEERLNRHHKTQSPKFSQCCMKGKVWVPLLQQTLEFLDQLLDVSGGPLSVHFRNNIRSYNGSLSFTSFGAQLDPRLANSRGPYSFVMHGENYHLMGSLLPPEGQPPKFLQLYVVDPEVEIQNRLSNFSSSDSTLKPEITELQSPDSANLRLRIVGATGSNNGDYSIPTVTEIAALIPGDFSADKNDRDIIINHRAEGLRRITSLNPKFEALHFIILFSYGEDGFHTKIRYRGDNTSTDATKKYVTQREYYAFRLQHRKNEGTTLLRGGKALQHYIVDAFSTIDQNRLIYLRNHQKELRSEFYQGLADAFHRGEISADNLGNIILPATYTGSPRYMKQLFLDSTSICQYFGNPHLFITFTCNSQWPEIVEAFSDTIGPHSECKPHIVARVFEMKLRLMKDQLDRNHFFGQTIAGLHTIEFQKRGLPHVHILSWLDPINMITEVDHIDSIISAELPDPEIDPLGYETVTKFMLHGPCGAANLNSPCMKNGVRSKGFPKAFCSTTTTDQFGYVVYRRRDLGITATKGGTVLDNRYVVPFNRKLLVLFQAHINVELCHQGRVIKYLFKYLTKGPDRSVAVAESSTNQGTAQVVPQPLDEIQQYLDCRSLSSYEAAWRIYEFSLHDRNPPVQRLCVHLPGQNRVPYRSHQKLRNIMARPNVGETTLTRWFKLNERDPKARELTYDEIPNKYVWKEDSKDWFPRKKGFAIGRIAYIHPGANDTFYLRQLLTKVRGALSFVHLRTVNGTVCHSFKVACQKLGLLANDDEWLLVMNEVGQWGMCSLLRTLFVSMLMFCELANPIDLFNKTWELMAEDISYKYRRENRVYAAVSDSEIVKNRLLQQLDHLLAAYTSSLAHFGLPTPTLDHSLSSTDHLLSAQLNYDAQAAYLTNRAIVAPSNEDVSKLNAYVLAQVPGPTKNYYSADTLSSDSKRMHELETLYPTEFLNSLSFNGVPEHVVTLKVFTPIMLLHNLNPSIGLCNGTRIMTTFLGDYVIKGVIIGGSFEGSTVAIPRVVLNINDSRWPFILKRRQFPVRLCYGMTINKSQRQTLERVGIYLPKPVFSHGQLYVAISRVKSASGLRILLLNDPSIPHGYTRNIVYMETFNGIEASFTEPST
ncbi:ATP-dependent DNA helicase PIF1 [Linum perenne]